MGIVYDMPFSEYAASPALNVSALKHMRKSPLEFQWRRDNPREDTPAMALGRLTHTAILEPTKFLEAYVLWDGGRRAGKEWDKFKMTAGARQIVTPTELQAAQDMQRAVRGRYEAARYLEHGRAEVSFFWENFGVACKGRADWVTEAKGEKILVGLKTARDCREWCFQRQAAQLGYHLQWAWYSRGWALVCGVAAARMVEIVVENTPPYDVAVYAITEETLAAGWHEYGKLLERYVECKASGKWPGAVVGEVEFQLPDWAAEKETVDFEGVQNGDK